MIHLDSYLYLSRHNIYYFRVVVPDGIREDLHKLEYRRSMQTRNPQTARTMARALRFCFEAHLAGIRSNMTSWEELRKILDKELERIVTAEQKKLKVSGPYPLAADDIWNNCAIPGYREAIQTISELRCTTELCKSSDNIPAFAVTLAEKILQSANINLDKSFDQFVHFCEATVKMYLEFTQQRISLNTEAQSFQTVPSPTMPPPQGIATNQPGGKPISEVIEKYCKEMMVGGNWTLKTETEYRAIYKLLINITNDIPISSVDYQL